ncbi:protein-L-isoaspartate(D-aspartate) O-methyltransferase [Thioalkalivibrio paradoxus]|uniref:Protein-L-isoaspartate O-methyltransferase n=1 Tax=Thioalkalivibrio paradoxus ARh 1 TaxID=713585 RepID=W0DLK8_9GAMM|nr:protein-L-isoaspartate(D-aspartate) O-methyltransferase [Thioalkalivibrio paradoxus]AHE98142.1 protein-L-isoaspartate O-methyltransferase [Thioalkalivibrio paradoxus ARh 1]
MASSRRQEIDTLVAEVEREFRETAGSTGISAPDARLVDALRRVPRDAFVPDDSARFAWENRALPIGHDQTISQPFVVALMTQLLELNPQSRVLEIGTGSGYQAALLAELAQEVFSVEVVPELARAAAERLQRLGYRNVRVRAGDGRRGWPEAAPFDAVIVTAGAESIPPALIEQLKEGGRLVIPVDSRWFGQDLTLVTRGTDGTVHRRSILAVIFVPLVGGDGGALAPES